MTTTAGVRRTGILGGTFDPPHIAHLVLAANARHDLALDEVIFSGTTVDEALQNADETITEAVEAYNAETF